VYSRFGWLAALTVLAALTALPLPFLLRYREREVVAAQAPAAAASLRTLGSFFRQPGAARWTLVVLPLYLVGLGAAYPLATPMLVDAGWPLGRIGTVSIVGGGAVAILASLAAGLLVSALGRRLALVAFGVVQVAAIAALLPLARGTGGALSGLAAVALLNAAYAMAGTAVYTTNMDWSRPGSAGTGYTLQDSFVHLCWQLAGSLGLGLAGGLGYPTMLAVSLVLGLAGVGAVAWLLGGDPGGITGASPGDRDDDRPASDHQPLGGAHAGRRGRDRGRTGQVRSSNGRRRPRGQADRLGDHARAHGAGLRVQRGGPGPDDRGPGG
jgi:predicted MFS family arabinose efflux permease